MKKTIIFIFCILYLSLPRPVPAQDLTEEEYTVPLRTFDMLFPNMAQNRRNQVFSDDGLIRSVGKSSSLEIIPASESGIGLHRTIMGKSPGFLAESLLVVPYSGKIPDKLDSYNALGKIGDLKGRLYRSHSRNSEVPLFEEATRLDNAKKTNPIPDPPPSSVLPKTETVYIRLKDTNFGNSYYKADFSTTYYGVIYNLTNFKSLSYLFFPIMKEERFSAILYIEPLVEGMLVYSVAGADASDFIANRIDIPTAISKRLAVFIGWVSDGLKAVK